MSFIDTIKERARQDKKTIVLPETMDRRIMEATEKILKEGIANIILIGKEEDIEVNSQGFDISKATIINPFTSCRGVYSDQPVAFRQFFDSP